MIIAIDGPAASGKGTLGKRLAHHYGFRHLDTGVIYRAVAKALLDNGFELTDEARALAVAAPLIDVASRAYRDLGAGPSAPCFVDADGGAGG